MIVDRLALRLTDMSADDARRLALAIAEGLAGCSPAAAAGAVADLRVSATRAPGEDLEALARRIVAELARRLDGES